MKWIRILLTNSNWIRIFIRFKFDLTFYFSPKVELQLKFEFEFEYQVWIRAKFRFFCLVEIRIFRIKIETRSIFVFTHAPGSSAYNQVERRMAPLSKDTSGLVLPFDIHGSHLNRSNKTIDEELERKNFKGV